MTNYRTGDLLLVTFPFVLGDRGKQRPALVLIDARDDDVLLARVTTQDRHRVSMFVSLNGKTQVC